MKNESIAEAVDQAELIPLLAALANYTGDTERFLGWISLEPVRMGATIPPQGGMTDEQVEKARALSVEALSELLSGRAVLDAAASAHVNDVLDWFCAGEIGNNRDLLRNEILQLSKADPDAAPAAPRRTRAVIVGAGLSGLALAYALRQRGYDFEILEKNPDVGGTWWENTYPGCRLDTPNYAYSYSFQQKLDWPDYYTKQPDVLAHIQDFAQSEGLRRKIRFNTEVLSAAYDEQSKQWTVRSRDHDGAEHTVTADVFVSATGQLNQPSIPDFEGAADFAGLHVHSAKWPADLDLRGKRVALIGAGASAFQVGPAIASEVEQLTIFQRNAPWLLPTPGYTASLPDQHIELLRSFAEYGRWYRLWQFWLSTEGRMPLIEVDENWKMEGSVSAANEAFRRELLEHLAGHYEGHPELLAQMTPSYPPGAKRMLRDNGDWAKTLKLQKVELVTEERIDHFTEAGIVAVSKTGEQKLREFDVVIYATGFKAQDFLYPIEVTGVGGIHLAEFWDGDAKAYATMMVPKFPNMFIMLGPNSGLAANGSIIFMSECQAHFIAQTLELTEHVGRRAVEVKVAAYEEFADQMDAANVKRAWGVPGVSTWYQNDKGRVSQNWPLELADYWNLTRTPNPQHFEFSGQLAEDGGDK